MTALLLALTLAADDGLATEKDYDISGKVVSAGAHPVFQLGLTPKNGYHVSADTPLSVALSTDAGLTMPSKIGRRELVDAKAPTPLWNIDFDSTKPGAHSVKADFVFFLCSDKLCQRMTAARTFTLSSPHQ